MILEKIANWANNSCDFNGTILIGRIDFNRQGRGDNLIIVDYLNSKDIYASSEFMGDREIIIHTRTVEVLITFDFYGNEALNNFNKLASSKYTELSKDNQKTQGITVKNVSNGVNIRQATESETTNRIQSEATVIYPERQIEDVKRIDKGILRYILNN